MPIYPAASLFNFEHQLEKRISVNDRFCQGTVTGLGSLSAASNRDADCKHFFTRNDGIGAMVSDPFLLKLFSPVTSRS